MKIKTVGLDLAKNVFQAHGVDERGVAVLRKQLERDQVAPFFARLQPCLIGIEACGGAHYRAAKLTALGHRVKIFRACCRQKGQSSSTCISSLATRRRWRTTRLSSGSAHRPSTRKSEGLSGQCMHGAWTL